MHQRSLPSLTALAKRRTEPALDLVALDEAGIMLNQVSLLALSVYLSTAVSSICILEGFLDGLIHAIAC